MTTAHAAELVQTPEEEEDDYIEPFVAPFELLNKRPRVVKSTAVLAKRTKEYMNPIGGLRPGFFSPWRRLDEHFRFLDGQFTMFYGADFCGKTTGANLVALCAAEQGVKPLVVSLEMDLGELTGWAYKQATGKPKITNEEIDEISEYYNNKIFYYDLVGESTPNRILQVVDWYVRNEGVKLIVVDSITTLDFESTGSNEYPQQKEFVNLVRSYAKYAGVHFIIIAHCRKPAQERAAGEGIRCPERSEIKGDSTLYQLSPNCIAFGRAEYKEDKLADLRLKKASLEGEIKRITEGKMEGNILEKRADIIKTEADEEKYANHPDAQLFITKNRSGGKRFKVPIWFDADSDRMKDRYYDEFPVYYKLSEVTAAEREEAEASRAVLTAECTRKQVASCVAYQQALLEETRNEEGENYSAYEFECLAEGREPVNYEEWALGGR